MTTGDVGHHAEEHEEDDASSSSSSSSSRNRRKACRHHGLSKASTSSLDLLSRRGVRLGRAHERHKLRLKHLPPLTPLPLLLLLLGTSAASGSRAGGKRTVVASTSSPPAKRRHHQERKLPPRSARTVRSLRCGPGSTRQPGRSPGSGGFCARRPTCFSCSTPSLVLVTVLSARRPSSAVSTFWNEWWDTVASTAATVCCSCRNHERRRRCLRRFAAPSPSTFRGRQLDSAMKSQRTTKCSQTCLSLVVVVVVVVFFFYFRNSLLNARKTVRGCFSEVGKGWFESQVPRRTFPLGHVSHRACDVLDESIPPCGGRGSLTEDLCR